MEENTNTIQNTVQNTDSLYDVAVKTHDIVCVICFVIILFFLFKFLKSTFKINL